MALIVVLMSMFVLVPIRVSMIMLVPISMLMLVPLRVPMIVHVPFCMPMGMGFSFCVFCHGMPMVMVAVLMVVLVVIITQLALFGVMLDALVMAVCRLVLLHGCGSSDCTPVLALNVEVSNQRLCLSAKDLLKVEFAMLTGEHLQANTPLGRVWMQTKLTKHTCVSR